MEKPSTLLVEYWMKFPPLASGFSLFIIYDYPKRTQIFTSKTTSMENTNWDQKLHALTHIITSPTFTPSLHSQFFISSQIPCYLNWDYPPLLCRHSAFPPPLLKWALFQFLNRIPKLGFPATSWRSKCPYQVPPPLILANGVEEAEWDEEGKREYVKGRFRRRKKVESNVYPLIPILVPNLLLFSLLLWDPIPTDENNVFSS